MAAIAATSLIIATLDVSADAGHDAKPAESQPSQMPHGRIQETPHSNRAAQTHQTGGHRNAPSAEKARENPLVFLRNGLVEADELYRENCVACHGSQGRGNGPLAKDTKTPAADLFVMAPSHVDGDLLWKTAKGRGKMPGGNEILTDEKIWMLVHYLKTFPAYQIVEIEHEDTR